MHFKTGIRFDMIQRERVYGSGENETTALFGTDFSRLPFIVFYPLRQNHALIPQKGKSSVSYETPLSPVLNDSFACADASAIVYD